jgi:hypothetical protein
MSTSILVTRLALLITFAALVIVGLVRRERVRTVLLDFFGAAGHPINLAIFRIVLFTVLFIRADVDSITWYAALSPDLHYPPPGWSWLLGVLPITPDIALAATWLVKVACVFAIIGLFSRTSAAVVCVVGLYALGILQFYGKVSHFHHLMWFAGLMAVSPAGHALSMDALIRAFRSAGSGECLPPERHVVYALPLRFVWLLMGLIFFFPGFWKAWRAGARWALSDNIRMAMYQKWTEFGDWAPAVRIDQYPVLYQASGLATMLFELSFIFLIFFGTGRMIALFGGLAFHQMTNLFMRISFWHLQPMYVSFVDWACLGERLGRRLYREELLVTYDPTNPEHARLVWVARAFDVLQRVGFNAGAKGNQLSVARGEEHFVGPEALRLIARRIPPVALLAFVWSEKRREANSDTWQRRQRLPRWRIAVVGGVLVVANATAGFLHLDTWPIAVYPTFAYFSGSTVSTLRMEVESRSGEVVDLPIEVLFGDQTSRVPARVRSLMRRVVSDNNPRRDDQLRAMFSFWLSQTEAEKAVRHVRFYHDTISTWYHGRPGQRLESRLVYQFDP